MAEKKTNQGEGDPKGKRTSLYYDSNTFFQMVDAWRSGPGKNEDGTMLSRNSAIIAMVEKTAKRDKI